VDFSLDANKLFNDAVAATQGGVGALIVFGLIFLILSPWIIPAISNAIAQQRQVTHQREQNLLKIRNSIADRAKRAKKLPGPK
jgi:hypothetical protein